MWLALDVDYRNTTAQTEEARCAVVGFEHWTDAIASLERVYRVTDVQPYESGAFYKRELPCLIHAIEQLRQERVAIDGVVVDGYVWLPAEPAQRASEPQDAQEPAPERARLSPGLGARLSAYLQAISIANGQVIGVAKTLFAGADRVAHSVLRGESKKPLWVTSQVVPTAQAALWVEQMDGEHRVPTLLRRVDQLCRA
jgi:deoxyribonuclease V